MPLHRTKPENRLDIIGGTANIGIFLEKKEFFSV
jgi:hypothetical protein